MRSTKGHLCVGGLVATLALGGCGALGADWKALRGAKLGQPIEAINTAALNASYEDNQGNVTRVAWAKLADGSTALLGLPSHGLPANQVVDRTVVLLQDEWEPRCLQAFPDRAVRGVSHPADNSAYGNTFVMWPGFAEPAGEGESTTFSRENDYCEFAFLPNGWEFRVVQNEGIIKTDLPGVPTN